MSTAKENSCRKFQANFFNKSKCQNCFKPRELHLLTDQDLTQAKPIYGGWLCLAPEGTDFDNPMQRSRKWQRRFFVLYEHGCLRFALDESPSTLPQGTVNMNLCTDVIDAEPKTGQKNSLCIITPEQEYFIRGENKEIINGWSEQLVVYPRTNKQNQKKKRKVEPATSQEPGPAKVAVTGSGIPDAERVPDSSSIIWQEELIQREAEGSAVWGSTEQSPGSPLPPAGDCASVAQGSDAGSVNGEEVDHGGLVLHGSVPQPPSGLLSPTGSCSSLGGIPRCLSPAQSDPFPSGSSLLSNGSHISGSVSSLDSDASGSTVTSTESHSATQRGGHSYSHHDTPRSRRLEAESRKAEKRSRFRSPERQKREPVLSPESSRSGMIEKLEALELENPEKMEVEESWRSTDRQGRSQQRRFHGEERKHDVGQGLDFPSTLPPLRRAKSLDRRTTESVMTPDLLNFKKGWMVKLDENGQWKKYWFVLMDHSLRYYKDSIAEEASDLDGEIDLSNCYNVTEYQAQRNYGFQIHTQEGVHTLSAMTAGIRRNWIQAVMKNVRPSTAPDVASSTEDHGPFAPLEGLVRPDVTQDSPSSEASSVDKESTPGVVKSRARERRREGRSKTFDWAEFRPIAQALAQQRAQEAECLAANIGELERNRRREERRKRYETVTGSSVENVTDKDAGKSSFDGVEETSQMVPDGPSLQSVERQQKVEEVIEEHWRQVEKTPIREERRVPLPSTVQTRDTAELEILLENYKQGMEDLKAQLETCHQQLLDYNKHKQGLELQLRTALEREHDVRTGYVSPPELHLGLEADAVPQTKRPELVSSQAQSLTKKYQETKELLKLQELKKRNMQAQLGLQLSHHATKDPCFSAPQSALEEPGPELLRKSVCLDLQDNAGAIQELDDLTAGKSLTVNQLAKVLASHSCCQEATDQNKLQKFLDSWRCQQELENELIKKSLARAGESIREYEARLITMEDLVGEVRKHNFESIQNLYGPLSNTDNHPETSDVTIGVLSQRNELLTTENAALKQRCQEIVNQLTEADREIDRLKDELINQQGGKQHHLVVQELKRLKAELVENQANAIDREYYERELNEKSLRLHEALITLEELGITLNETEKKLQLKEATLKGLGFQDDYEQEGVNVNQEQLKDRLEASEAKLFETESSLHIAEQQCVQLEAKNRDLIRQHEESQVASESKLREAENEIRLLRERLEVKTSTVQKEVCECAEEEPEQGHSKGPVEQVIDEIERKFDATNKVIAMLEPIKVDAEKMLSEVKSTLFVSEESSKEKLMCLSPEELRLVFEGELCWQLQETLKAEEGDVASCEGLVAQQLALKCFMLLNSEFNPITHECADALQSNLASMYSWYDEETHAIILRKIRETLVTKSCFLTHMTRTLKTTEDEKLLALAKASFAVDVNKQEYLLDTLREVYSLYTIFKLKMQHEKDAKLEGREQCDSVPCEHCCNLRELTQGLKSQVADLQTRLCEASMKTPSSSQTSVQIDRQPIDPVDKTIVLQDLMARHSKELQEVKDGYEQAAHKLTQEMANANEALHIQSEENIRKIDSLSSCMENLRKRHEEEQMDLVEKFDQEMEELRIMIGQAIPDVAPTQSCDQPATLKERIKELVKQVSIMTEEMRRREEQDDVTALRLKYQTDLENLKVEALLVLAVAICDALCPFVAFPVPLILLTFLIPLLVLLFVSYASVLLRCMDSNLPYYSMTPVVVFLRNPFCLKPCLEL